MYLLKKHHSSSIHYSWKINLHVNLGKLNLIFFLLFLLVVYSTSRGTNGCFLCPLGSAFTGKNVGQTSIRAHYLTRTIVYARPRNLNTHGSNLHATRFPLLESSECFDGTLITKNGKGVHQSNWCWSCTAATWGIWAVSWPSSEETGLGGRNWAPPPPSLPPSLLLQASHPVYSCCVFDWLSVLAQTTTL